MRPKVAREATFALQVFRPKYGNGNHSHRVYRSADEEILVQNRHHLCDGHHHR